MRGGGGITNTCRLTWSVIYFIFFIHPNHYIFVYIHLNFEWMDDGWVNAWMYEWMNGCWIYRSEFCDSAVIIVCKCLLLMIDELLEIIIWSYYIFQMLPQFGPTSSGITWMNACIKEWVNEKIRELMEWSGISQTIST